MDISVLYKQLRQHLKEVFRQEAQKLLEEAKRMHKNERTFITREEVAERLNVSLSTVHAWTEKGILKKYRIGERQVRYRLDEVLNALEEVKSDTQNQ